MQIKRILPAAAFLTLTALLCGMDWPAQEGVINRNFGWNDKGRPVKGVSFAAEGPVRAADAGEILFYNDPESSASRIPSPLGAWIALDHGDGLMSIYSRLDEKRLPESLSLVEKDTVIASSGRSGWSGAAGFFFSIFDRRERRWVNPVMIVAPLPDTRPPAILSATLKNAGGVVNLAQTRTISQGRYTVAVEVSDTREGNDELPLAPFRIGCSLNGVEMASLSFETFSVRDGIAMAYRNSLAPAQEVYAPYPAFEIGDIVFTRGRITLEITALDAAQNPRTVTYQLQVD
ncbi:MAG: M23 family metallopeptidase [Treponema sp.]|jgi:hypothetical protein|nr:M23 family metallopeptidase [Treponema sp.]